MRFHLKILIKRDVKLPKTPPKSIAFTDFFEFKKNLSQP